MEKIKINFDKNTLNKITEDMNAFNFSNKNNFLNVLLKNYFPTYDNIANKQIEKCSKIVNNHISNQTRATEIINDLIKSDPLFAFTKKDSLKHFISFKPTIYNKKIINMIYNKYLNYQSLSSFFRNMIDKYFSLPQYKREQIMCLDNYTLIQEAIESNRIITISIKGETKEVVPYKLVTNKEEIYNYLICFSTNQPQFHISSYRLYKIDHIYLQQQKANISESQLELLDKVSSTYPQFPFSKHENSVIQLSPQGVKLYASKYLNKPIPYKIENDLYYFDCAHSQILFHFFSYGKDAKIIEPAELKEIFKQEYLAAYETYK